MEGLIAFSAGVILTTGLAVWLWMGPFNRVLKTRRFLEQFAIFEKEEVKQLFQRIVDDDLVRDERKLEKRRHARSDLESMLEVIEEKRRNLRVSLLEETRDLQEEEQAWRKKIESAESLGFSIKADKTTTIAPAPNPG
ncbi:MAG: hypothetical protein Q8Q15_04410 [bacterium]|nr:hypothetical protein [bacterium]